MKLVRYLLSRFTMYLSKTSGYALHALISMESAEGRSCFVHDIAQATGIKKPYLAKIINQLVHRGFVVAKRGYRGGVSLARPASEITLLEIVQAIEGEGWSRPCLFGLEDCRAQASCPAHALWQETREKIDHALRVTTLAQIITATQMVKKVVAGARVAPDVLVGRLLPLPRPVSLVPEVRALTNLHPATHASRPAWAS